MDKLVIEGGKPLEGEITISGSKNACLPMMMAALLSDEPTTLHNVPRLRDVEWMNYLLGHLGAKVKRDGHTLSIHPGGFDTDFVPYDIMRKMRASMYAMGPMIARLGRARISLPGGCAIGERPVDIHLRGFEALGCSIVLRHGYVHAKHNGLKGGAISLAGLRGSSVGATCNLMMAAALATGESILTAAAREPEVVQLGQMLQAMGAEIEGLGTRTIRVWGRGQGSLSGATMSIIPDRIETATYMVAGAITRGDLLLRNVAPGHMTEVIETMREIGVEIATPASDLIRITPGGSRKGTRVVTRVYPGVPTDVQAPLTALLSICSGTSWVEEKIYNDRFMHVPELRRLGANLRQEESAVTIQGVSKLCGAPVMASDLRCGAALVLAGLAAEGLTEVLRVYHVDRGYEKIEEKLQGAGAVIRRCPADEAVATVVEQELDLPPAYPAEFGFMPSAAVGA